MPAYFSAEDSLAVLSSRLQSGVRATPLCLAVMGWLCGRATVPYIANIRLQGNQVLLRLSDEPTLEPFCSLPDFLGQVRLICQSLNMPEEQTQQVLACAQRRLE